MEAAPEIVNQPTIGKFFNPWSGIADFHSSQANEYGSQIFNRPDIGFVRIVTFIIRFH